MLQPIASVSAERICQVVVPICSPVARLLALSFACVLVLAQLVVPAEISLLMVSKQFCVIFLDFFHRGVVLNYDLLSLDIQIVQGGRV